MRVTGGVNIRAAWYDRNPLPVNDSITTTVAGGVGAYTGATHTVSANKKCLINSITIILDNHGVGTDASNWTFTYSITPNGGANTDYPLFRSLRCVDGGTKILVIPCNIMLSAGDLIEIEGSRGTTVNAQGVITIINGNEFDA
ncbi:MAG: hypothetical protein H8D23_25295 [Candidatus Brocadiales bacterium]|nr:hypothetical protein [Candidatus Brocadiales bacterium]